MDSKGKNNIQFEEDTKKKILFQNSKKTTVASFITRIYNGRLINVL